MRNTTIARDALQNAATDSGASDEYVRGVVLGLVSGLMAAEGWTFNKAWDFVKQNLPANARPNYAPEAWLKE